MTYHIFVAKLDQINFIKYQDIFNAELTKLLGAKSFDPPLMKKKIFHRFSWKQVKFELQLPHSLLFIFSKNHFQVHKYLFNHRNIKSFPTLNHQLGTGKPIVLTAFRNKHKKFKKNQKIGKPSHWVIICGQVPRKNNKLVIWQLF